MPEERLVEEDLQEESSGSGDKEMAAQKRSAFIFAVGLPLFFIIMFPLAYVTALHQPALHDFPVGVVGTEQGAQEAVRGISANTGEMFEFTTVGSREEAQEEIFAQNIKAAYIPGEEPTLLIAGADGQLATQYVPQVFTGAAAGQGSELSVVDVAPLAAGDATGIGLMFYMLIPILIGFMAANILGLAAGWFLSVRERLGILAVLAVLSAVVPWAFMGPWLQILQGGFGQIAAIIALAAIVSFIVAMISTALVEIMNKWAIFVLITAFVFLNIPSSGATFPTEAVPTFFGFISHFHIGAAMIETLRSVLYFGGEGLLQPLLVISAWLLLGVGLLTFAISRNRHAEQEAAANGESGAKDTGASAAPVGG